MVEEIPLLQRLGLGALDTSAHVSPPGRNDNRVGTTAAGPVVFVKRLDAQQPDAAKRFSRLVRFETRVGTVRDSALRTPVCLGWDADELTAVFEWHDAARTGADLAKEEAFTEELALDAGRAVGALHSLPAASTENQEEKPSDDQPLLPPMEFFEALPLLYYAQASGASLEAWRLMQSDEKLAAGLRDLRSQESAVVKTAAHCDVRLDQFLLHEGLT
jgi:hypothetical protein